jgi:hypothetical protein
MRKLTLALLFVSPFAHAVFAPDTYSSRVVSDSESSFIILQDPLDDLLDRYSEADQYSDSYDGRSSDYTNDRSSGPYSGRSSGYPNDRSSGPYSGRSSGYTNDRSSGPSSGHSRDRSSGSNSRAPTVLNESLTRGYVSYLNSSIKPEVLTILSNAATDQYRGDNVIAEMYQKSRRMRLIPEAGTCGLRRDQDGRIIGGAMAHAELGGTRVTICHLMSNVPNLSHSAQLFVILHEVAHLAGISDECSASDYAEKAMTASGISRSSIAEMQANCSRTSRSGRR